MKTCARSFILRIKVNFWEELCGTFAPSYNSTSHLRRIVFAGEVPVARYWREMRTGEKGGQQQQRK
jgi:hypothetical protein